MNKTNTKSITLVFLAILAIFSLGLTSTPTKTNAQQLGGYVVTGNENLSQPNPYYYQNPIYIQNPTPIVYTNPAPTTQVVYSNTVNPNASKTAPKTVAKAKPTTPQVAKDMNDSSLAANAIFGSNTFMPSGIVQWIFFAILILLIVLLARKIFGAEKNYHATPLKHD